MRHALDTGGIPVNTLFVKTSFDLPDQLLRRAKAVAAEQGRPLRDLMAEALDEKLDRSSGGQRRIPGYREGLPPTWEEWRAGVEELPDGRLFNPSGIDESFFEILEEIRRRPWGRRAASTGTR